MIIKHPPFPFEANGNIREIVAPNIKSNYKNMTFLGPIGYNLLVPTGHNCKCGMFICL